MVAGALALMTTSSEARVTVRENTSFPTSDGVPCNKSALNRSQKSSEPTGLFGLLVEAINGLQPPNVQVLSTLLFEFKTDLKNASALVLANVKSVVGSTKASDASSKSICAANVGAFPPSIKSSKPALH